MSLSTGKRSCFIILYHFQNLVKNRFSGNVVDVFFKKKKKQANILKKDILLQQVIILLTPVKKENKQIY